MSRGQRTGAARVAAAGLAALLASGCTVGPDYKPPAVAVPSAWSEAQGGGIDSGSGELARWWTVFNDPLLNLLVERAVQSNLDLRQAEARIREARASRAIAASAAWPTVDATGSYRRTRTSENALALPAQGGGTPVTAGTLDSNLFQAGFDASWELDVFGGVRRNVEAADASIGAAVEDRRNVLVTLLGELALNYTELRGFQRRIAVARANLATQRDTVQLTRIRFEAGLVSALDVVQAEAQLRTTEAEIPPLETSLKQAAHRIAVLLARDPGALWPELAPVAPVPGVPPTVLVGLPSELLRRRPDIRQAERQLAAATALIGAATADLFPKFSLLAPGGLQSVSASDWFTAGSRYWSVGPSVSWNVFDAGRTRAAIEVRNAQEEGALRGYEKTVLSALEEVENALVSYSREQARRQALAEAVAANRQALEMSNDLYVQGLSDFLNVLDAQRSLFTSESDLAQSEATIASNLVALYKALGGGWEVSPGGGAGAPAPTGHGAGSASLTR